MAKIRSTLDIVMERTRGMSMSREDRERLRDRELSDEARAWAQWYLDGKWSWEDIQARLESAGDERPRVTSLLENELASGIRLGADNTGIIDILGRLSEAGADRISEVVELYLNEMRSALDRCREERRRGLEAEGIRGSALVPNAESDPSWQESLRELHGRLKDRLAGIL